MRQFTFSISFVVHILTDMRNYSVGCLWTAFFLSVQLRFFLLYSHSHRGDSISFHMMTKSILKLWHYD